MNKIDNRARMDQTIHKSRISDTISLFGRTTLPFDEKLSSGKIKMDINTIIPLVIEKEKNKL